MIYKIPHRSYSWSLCTLIFFCVSQAGAQPLTISQYGTPVMDKVEQYQNAVKMEPDKKLVELHSVSPGIVYDLRYAGTNNFISRRMYPPKTRHTFMRKPAAEALALVQKELNEQKLGLKIYDAYRPYSVTVTFWELIKDERYVANPSKGSGHNRGLAVDLTIIDLTTGKELDMGTGFDNFTDTAHHTFTSLPSAVMQNRKLFKDVMTKHGFEIFETEWWHYFWPNNKEYEVMDLGFEKRKKF